MSGPSIDLDAFVRITRDVVAEDPAGYLPIVFTADGRQSVLEGLPASASHPAALMQVVLGNDLLAVELVFGVRDEGAVVVGHALPGAPPRFVRLDPVTSDAASITPPAWWTEAEDPWVRGPATLTGPGWSLTLPTGWRGTTAVQPPAVTPVDGGPDVLQVSAATAPPGTTLEQLEEMALGFASQRFRTASPTLVLRQWHGAALAGWAGAQVQDGQRSREWFLRTPSGLLFVTHLRDADAPPDAARDAQVDDLVATLRVEG